LKIAYRKGFQASGQSLMTRFGTVLETGRLVRGCARRVQFEAMEKKRMHGLE